jgi:AcrR family transcriptional regulator
MTTETRTSNRTREPLTRERVMQAAVAYADEHGVEELSMRKLGAELGVEAMSLYHHVRNKDEILDGMVDLFAMEIQPTGAGDDWRSALRAQILTAREAVRRHPWFPEVIDSRKQMSIPVLRYFDSVGGIMLDGGFSVELMHHAFHALGSRVLGFNRELYDDKGDDSMSDEEQEQMLDRMRPMLPNIARVMDEIRHREESIIGSGCDDDVEFIFSLDLLLDGLERKRLEEAASAG